MSEIKFDHILSGIAMMACLIGLLILGLALGESLANGTAYGGHTLFMPGLSCIGAGILIHYIMFLLSPK